ncbi:YciK family oxidoreductase [Hahella sp. HN01]|uniref:YciK family oxidoreductase n=1 Tax=unclassified Hahella TaxID=2624107 RepID=UPI001C1EDC2C|nr:YciK family oxidoreductase [Hahella sp. HN01]MBU6955009.1 YciK family oxidoreductase [Hahella sp. HN01]
MYSYQAPADLLHDRVILITGAGAGIGRAAAKTFARHGATIILSGRTTKKLEDVYDEIEAEGGPKPAIFPVNLEGAVAKDYDDLANAIREEFGRLDGLLHNAAILGHRTPLEHYDPDSWARVMQVNAMAPFLLTRSLMPVIRESEDASIVFTSSSVGRKGKAYWGAYAVSKFAVEGMMQVLADELDDADKRIRVNSVNPGATRTAMRALAYPAEDATKNPTPEEIMNVYLYLMGKDSIGVTGQAFNAQGD